MVSHETEIRTFKIVTIQSAGRAAAVNICGVWYLNIRRSPLSKCKLTWRSTNNSEKMRFGVMLQEVT